MKKVWNSELRYIQDGMEEGEFDSAHDIVSALCEMQKDKDKCNNLNDWSVPVKYVFLSRHTSSIKIK